MIEIPIEIGDIVRVGRFKNKRIKVKSIEYDAYGLPIINGRPLLTMRIEKLMPKQENSMKKTELQKLIREEIRKVIKEETFKVFGGVHSDEQLDAMEDSLKIFKSKDPKVWEKYIKTLVSKGYNKPSHKEHPHYVWATKQLAKFK